MDIVTVGKTDIYFWRELNNLITKYGACLELFASVMNHNLKYYCSLFYDLEKYFQYLEPDKAMEARITNQKDNPSYIAEKEPEKPLTERIPYLLSGILTLTSLFLIFLVFKFLKK